MKDQDKTKQQLISELEESRGRVLALEQAEAKLRDSERTLRTLIDANPESIYLLDTDGTILLANETAARRLDKKMDEVVGQKPQALLPPEVANERLKRVKDVVYSGKAMRFQDKRFDRYFEIAIHPILDDQGKVTAVTMLGIDRTDQKRAEEALKQAHDELEQRVKERTAELTRANEELAIFRMFTEASGEGFGMSDFDGRIVYVNPTLCRLFGEEKPENFIGQTVSRYYPDEYVQRRASEMIPALLQDGYWYAEQTVFLRDGMPIQTSQSTFLIRDENGDPFRIAVVVSDITERKRAEEALAESEAKYRHLVEATDTGYLILDAEGRVVDANAEYVRLTGHRALSEIMGRRVEEWTAPNEAERNIQEVQECLATGAVRQLEVSYLGPDGKVTPIEVNANVIETRKGKQILSLCRDITERKRAEEALQQSHEEFRTIYDGMGDGLLVADIETRQFVRANTAICQMLGYSKDELLSLAVKDIHPEADLPFVVGQFQALAEGTLSVSEEIPVLRKDGTVFYAVVSNSRVTCFGRRCVVGFFRDVTERKRSQEAVRQSHDELQAIYDGMVDGLHILNLATLKPVRANSALCRMMGYSEEEILLLGFSDVHPPEQLSRIQEEFRARLKEQAFRWSDIPLVRKDGSVFYADITGSQIVYNGTPCLMCFFRDITERKKTQEALERERQSLWKMLQASDHERQIISYEIHDGLAQYLAAAGMQFQVFDAIRESNPEAAKKAYDAAVQLVSQSHFEARRLINEVRPPVIDENGIEMAISHLVHEQRRHGGPTIKFDSDVQFKRLPSILENAIYRIVQEALTNACKHSKAKRVAVTLAQEGQDVRLEVRDWGIGFAPESVEKGHFGLEGIRQRVRLLGGRLNIESTPDFGTLIQVVVPIVERQSEE